MSMTGTWFIQLIRIRHDLPTNGANWSGYFNACKHPRSSPQMWGKQDQPTNTLPCTVKLKKDSTTDDSLSHLRKKSQEFENPAIAIQRSSDPDPGIKQLVFFFVRAGCCLSFWPSSQAFKVFSCPSILRFTPYFLPSPHSLPSLFFFHPFLRSFLPSFFPPFSLFVPCFTFVHPADPGNK